MFFVAPAEISLLGKVNRVVTRLITRGVVVLRLLDSGLRIRSRIGVSRSAYNESYPEPDGRSGTHIPIMCYSAAPSTNNQNATQGIYIKDIKWLGNPYRHTVLKMDQRLLTNPWPKTRNNSKHTC